MKERFPAFRTGQQLPGRPTDSTAATSNEALPSSTGWVAAELTLRFRLAAGRSLVGRWVGAEELAETATLTAASWAFKS